MLCIYRERDRKKGEREQARVDVNSFPLSRAAAELKAISVHLAILCLQQQQLSSSQFNTCEERQLPNKTKFYVMCRTNVSVRTAESERVSE